MTMEGRYVEIRFTLLGPVQVLADGEAVRGIAPRHRAVLAHLLLNAGRVIGMERLIDAMWGHDRPDTARSQIHAAITALRRALRGIGADDVLETRPGGYVAIPGPGRLDVQDFTELVAAGRFRDALELWNGDALADVHAAYARGARALLDDRRLSAVERLMEAELDAGHHHRVLDELAGHVAAQPLRERLVGQLVLALHRSGRQADALAAARSYRTALAEEQGLDPGRAFTALERAVLTDAPALRPETQAGTETGTRPETQAGPGTETGTRPETQAGPGTGDTAEDTDAGRDVGRARSNFLPYDIPDFAGRTAELDRLVAERRSPIVTIDGMAGIGKTTLAVRAAHRLADRFPDGQLFIDLRAHAAGRDPLPASAALEALLRQLGLTDIPTAESERSALWRAELARRRVVAVLDNAADGEHVRPLLPGASGSLLLITSRRRLIGLDGAHALSVEVLPPRDAVALFGSIVGERAAAEPEAVRRVLELCGHLPLALRICAARLQHRPRWTVSYLAGRLHDERRRLAELATPERSVGAAFTVSYEQLGTAERRMFRLLGTVPGRDIEPHAAAALAGVSAVEAEELLESLLDAHMLLQHEPGRYTLHDLLREHARSLAEGRDTDGDANHRTDGGTNHRTDGGTNDDADGGALIRLLLHYLHRSRSAVLRLFPHSIPDRPNTPPQLTPVEPVGDAAEAIGWLDAERANIIATVVHGPEVCISHLAVALSPYLDRRAHHDDALTLHTIALQRSRALGERAMPPGRALADLSWTHWRRGDYERSESFAHQALAVCEDPHERSLALNALGNVAWRRRESTQAERCLREALDLTRIAGDRPREGFVLADLGRILVQTGRHEEARRHLDLALALHRKEGDRLGEARVLNHLGSALRHQGRAEEAMARHRRAGELYRAMGNGGDEASALNGLGEAALALGDPARAVDEHTAALALAGAARNRPEQARAHDGLARAHLGLGQGDRAREHGRSALGLYEELGVPEIDEVRAFLGGAQA
ncbi:BTAD domain-containing putative transcriptional regulator [Planomonospora sp. ID82291]|uniref:AfsR/SARP family transcriptional regulator n=1 Tax=Planomonospora sp. ID82291 TaxID=2738136 RepID=UPI0018C35DF1|nr:BTAD domain-containing putative transcriptional regulator [Planomonospora sp. ID82291]MBG0814892.1 tetratricopeptide repeat protein [Planomonospora sp. ID82291]